MLCLPKEISDKFRKAIREGDLKIPELRAMSTTELNEAFGEVLGEEYAQDVTLLWEKKIVLKDQQEGIIDFIKTVGGLKPEARRDLINQILKKEKAFTPDEFGNLKEEIINQTLDLKPTREEVKRIVELSKKINEAENYTGIKDTEDLIAAFEKLDQKTLSAAQKQAIKDLRSKLEEQKAQDEAEARRIVAEKEAIKEKARQKRETLRAEKEKERAEIRENKKLQKQFESDLKAYEKEVQRREAELEKDIAREEARIAKEEQTAQEQFDRENARAEKARRKADMKSATGEALRKLTQVFLKPKDERFKSIEQFPKELQDQLKDVVQKYKDIENNKDRMIYGRAKVKLENYINSITEQTLTEQFKEKPIEFIGGVSKSMKGTLDNSSLGRQGLKTLFTNPLVWIPNARDSFKYIWDTFGGKAVMDEIRADIVSRENYRNGYYRKMNLAVNVREELQPSSVPEKIPYYRKAFQASGNAFTGFLQKTRADLADLYIKIYQGNDIELNDRELKSLGKYINSQTGRGALGKQLEPSANIFNNIFFSVRFLKSNIDTLTLYAFDEGITKETRKLAAKSLAKIIAGEALIQLIAYALNPESVEPDPRSADFGKVKIGNTRFDPTAGMGSLVVLAARFLPSKHDGEWGRYTKSSATGKITKLNSDEFGSRTVGDVISDFFENKLSPLAAFVKNVAITGKGFDGKPVNITREVIGLFTALPMSNAYETFQDPDSAPLLAVMISDGLGFGTNTYPTPVKTQQENKTTDLIKQNYTNKQEGKPTKTVNEIAKEVYGDGADNTQKGEIKKQIEFYNKFGADNKWANKIQKEPTALGVIEILIDAKKEMGEDEFRKFYNKARTKIEMPSGGTSTILISNPLDKKWNEYVKNGSLPDADSITGNAEQERTVRDIISVTAKALGTDPKTALKALLQNQSIRRIDNGTLIINRNTDFFDTKLGKSGYSEDIRKERNAGKEQILDHTIPVAGGGFEKKIDADNLLLISEAEWKKNTPVENYLTESLQAKKINGKQLREYIIRYKAGRGQAISERYMEEYQKEYGAVPLTFDEIKALIP